MKSNIKNTFLESNPLFIGLQSIKHNNQINTPKSKQ